MSAYTQLRTALEGVLPDGWGFDAYEKPETAGPPDVTRVEMKIREVSPLPAAGLGTLRVDWVVTITSPTPSRETADPALFDDLIAFLVALDADQSLDWLVWTNASKTVGSDLDRLAYDITIQTHHARTPDEPA